ncbi:MAG: hypothetical protein WCK16_01515 [Candidatus Moraniibacteriota bacterium]
MKKFITIFLIVILVFEKNQKLKWQSEKSQSVENRNSRFSINGLKKIFWIFVDVPSQHGESPGHIAAAILRKEDAMENKTECPQCGAKIAFCAEYCAECQYHFSSRLERDWEDRYWTQVVHWVESLDESPGMIAVPEDIKKILVRFFGGSSRYVGNAQYFKETSDGCPSEVRVLTSNGGILTRITGLPPV